MKTLSVIITTLNASGQIQRLFDSFREQDTRQFEIIIVDAGSTDGTLDLIKESNLPIELIIRPGISIYGGINEALLACKSDYYIVSGSDDVLCHNAISTILRDIDTSNYDLLLYSVKKEDLVKKSYYPTRLRLILGWQSIVSSHSVGTVVKTKLHQEFGHYSLKYPVLSDGYFFSKLLAAKKHIFVSDQVIGAFGMEGTSNQHFFNNIFTTFLIQIESYSFLPQLTLLVFRLIKYRRRATFNRK